MSSEALDKAKDAVFGGKAVLMVGAGAAVPVGKVWQTLVTGLATISGIVPEDGESNGHLVDRCIEANEPGCVDFLRAEFRNYPTTVRTVLLSLLRLPFKAILSTNFDPWLRQNAFGNQIGQVWVYPHLRGGTYQNLPTVRDPSQKIDLWYLHGVFDAREGREAVSEIVFGEKSFNLAYGPGSLLPGFLLDVFTYETVLFVGFQPTEDHVANLLRQSIEVRRAIKTRVNLPDTKKFWLLAREDAPENIEGAVAEADFLEKLQGLEVTPSWFDRVDNSYSGLDRLLGEWVFSFGGPTAPPPFAGGEEMREGIP